MFANFIFLLIFNWGILFSFNSFSKGAVFLPEKEIIEEKTIVSKNEEHRGGINQSQITNNRRVVVSSSQKTKEDLEGWFLKYGNEYGVNPQLLKAIAQCESSFNPAAVNGPYGGLFQFLEATWKSTRRVMGLDEKGELRFDPEEAIRTAAFKIKRDGTGAWPVCGKINEN